MSFSLFETLKNDLAFDDINRTVAVVPQLSVKNYSKVKSILNRLGGKWITSHQHFQFSKCPQKLIDRVLAFGSRKINKFHLYPTPVEIFEYMTEHTALNYFGASETKVKVLEPSAGEGSLIGGLLDFGAKEGRDFIIDGYDIDPLNVLLCQESGFNVREANFLEVTPIEEYDLVVMNPPFNGDEFIKHIQHAQKFLKSGGLLLSVVPTGWITSSQENIHRQWLLEQAQIDSSSDLEIGNYFEPGTFKGVSISTAVVSLRSKDDAERALNSIRYKNDAVAAFDFYIDNHNTHFTKLQDIQFSKASKNDALEAINNIVEEVMQDASEETIYIPRRFHTEFAKHLLGAWFPQYLDGTKGLEPTQIDFFDLLEADKAA